MCQEINAPYITPPYQIKRNLLQRAQTRIPICRNTIRFSNGSSLPNSTATFNAAAACSELTTDCPNILVKSSDHLARGCIIYPPQRLNNLIEPSKLHPSCEVKHLVRNGLVPHRRMARRQEWTLGMCVAFPNDTHTRERPVQQSGGT